MAASIDGNDDAVNSCLVARGFNFAACAWRALCRTVRGLKTLIAAGSLSLVGLADELNGTDILDRIKAMADNDHPKLGRYIIIIGLGFAVLRFVTKSQMAGRHKRGDDEGETK